MEEGHVKENEENQKTAAGNNTDVVDNRKLKAFWTVLILCIISICFNFGFVFLASAMHEKNKQLQDTIEGYKKEQEALVEQRDYILNNNVQLITEKTTLQNDLGTLQKRLEGIKNQDDLLRRDIELYIDQKFKVIPKVLCKDIAVNVVKYSKEHDVSPELVIGIIQVESRFNPSAISKKGARGLMQVMPEWVKKFNIKDIEDLHDVDTNINAGIKVLKIHIEKDGGGSVKKGLYYYVGKDTSYADTVYNAMGKFVSFRYTVGDAKIKNGDDDETEEPLPDDTSSVKIKGKVKEALNEVVQRTENSN